MIRILPWLLVGASAIAALVVYRDYTLLESKNQELQQITGQQADQIRNLTATNTDLTNSNISLKSENEQLVARKDVIASFVVRLTVLCATANELSPAISAHAATVATLSPIQGETIRLVDAATSNLQSSTTSTGQHYLTFRYRAENEAKIVGHRINDLSSITTLGVRYDAVLNAMNLKLTRIAFLVVQVNGIDVLEIDDLSVPHEYDSTNSTFSIVSLGSCFSKFGEKYSSALGLKIQSCVPAR